MQGERRIERLGKRTVDAAKPAAEVYRLWDSDLKGFGLKVTPRGVKTYFLWYRGGAGRNAVRREYTLGCHGAITAEEAREEAGKALGTPPTLGGAVWPNLQGRVRRSEPQPN